MGSFKKCKFLFIKYGPEDLRGHWHPPHPACGEASILVAGIWAGGRGEGGARRNSAKFVFGALTFRLRLLSGGEFSRYLG